MKRRPPIRSERRYSKALTMHRFIIIFSVIFVFGCQHTRGGYSGITTQPSRDICFSRSEAAEIRTHQIRCKIQKKRLDRLKEQCKLDAIEHIRIKASLKKTNLALASCLQRQKSLQKNCRPAKCILPWIVVGAVAAASIAGMIAITVSK